MASKRIGKSAIDWAKFARLVPESDKANYNVFKARSDGYLMSVITNPDSAPAIDFKGYKENITNKAVVDELEAAYKSSTVAYPTDDVTPSIDDQQKRSVVEYEEFCKLSNAKVADAQGLIHKFKMMIPYDEMLNEDFQLTFPDWCVSRDSPSIWPHPEKQPGISRAEAAELNKPDGAPYSIP